MPDDKHTKHTPTTNIYHIEHSQLSFSHLCDFDIYKYRFAKFLLTKKKVSFFNSCYHFRFLRLNIFKRFLPCIKLFGCCLCASISFFFSTLYTFEVIRLLCHTRFINIYISDIYIKSSNHHVPFSTNEHFSCSSFHLVPTEHVPFLCFIEVQHEFNFIYCTS